MTEDELKTIEDRCSAATNIDEWECVEVSGDAIRRTQPSAHININTNASWFVGPSVRSMMQAKKDAEFVKHARSDVLFLISEIRSLLIKEKK